MSTGKFIPSKLDVASEFFYQCHTRQLETKNKMKPIFQSQLETKYRVSRQEGGHNLTLGWVFWRPGTDRMSHLVEGPFCP